MMNRFQTVLSNFTSALTRRWYRAPEVLLRSPYYNAPIDQFAIGVGRCRLTPG
jgi:serine/threonine protein kinase